MFKFGRKRKSKWHGVNFLEMIPQKILTEETNPENGNTVLLVPRYTDPVLKRLLQPRLNDSKKYLRVPLENRGAYLWTVIDGKTAIYGFLEGFIEKFPEHTEQAPERIANYLAHMENNRFIRFVNKP